ncbi:MAG: electron transfer flavoprotein subunit beta [Myxococcales bacterium]|nr:electron transfer flavoprotein subunit beta [Myxococcales bacterium]
MKILVAVKRVTDPDARIRLNADATGIDMTGVEYKVNPFCENAVEGALQLRDAAGGEVVVVSIGPEEVDTYIRTGLAMGGDRGIRVPLEDENLDSDVVARVLAALVAKEEPELVMLGKQAIDGDNNQVAQLLAGYLGWPQACFASEIALSDDQQSAEVTREVDGGLEVLNVGLPAVISADLRLNEPRYASLPGIMKAKRKTIDVYEAADLGVDTTVKVRVLKLESPPERAAGIKVDSVDDLLGKLRNEAKAL